MNIRSFLQPVLILAAGVLFLISCAKPATAPPVIEEEEEDPPPTEVVLEFAETPSGLAEAARMGRAGRGPASDFTPTGYYLPPNTTLHLHVEQLAQGTGTPTLLIGSYSRYEAKWDPTAVPLSFGNNTIQGDAHGGILYVRYNAPNDAPASGRIRITFANGHEPHPYFVLGETTNAQWQTMLDTWADAPDVVLANNGAIVVASRSKALEYRSEDQTLLLELIDEALQAEYAISGMDGSAPEHQPNVHKIVMTETDMEDTFMAATWYRTWYHRSVVNHILTVEGFRDDGWGPWHELGHHHQQDAWSWEELGEVTVNIYSLAAERAMGITPSRLVRDGAWFDVASFLALPDSERDYNAATTGFFVRLGMFQQLWLEYGDSFFQQLHKQVREEKPTISDRAAKMRYFMLQASQIAGNDLGPFFRKWGLPADEAVYNEISALGLPLPETDLTARTDDPDWESRWLVVDHSSQETAAENGRATNLIDGDPDTYWHSRWSSSPATFPHHITVDMRAATTVNDFTLTQRTGQRRVKDIEISVSNDNASWQSLGEFVLADAATPQNLELASARTFRYVRVTMKSAHDGDQFAALAELAVH